MQSLVPAVGQMPGYGDKPDQWAPYESGKYFERLQKIISTYRFANSKVTYLRFEENGVGVGPVELFRISLAPDCSEGNCYFVLFASDLETPLVTPCIFWRAKLVHLFSPDGSRFFGFEFSCSDAVLQVKVTPTHLMAIPVPRTP
jgi:hypothetical protein